MTLLLSLIAGNNHLSKLDRMMYLRQFDNLELVNLAGNPLCREANYRAYMMSHIKRLKFLDYVRVNPDDVGAAFEHYQVWKPVPDVSILPLDYPAWGRAIQYFCAATHSTLACEHEAGFRLVAGACPTS